MSPAERQLPVLEPTVTAETKPFFDAAREGRLKLVRCTACKSVIWYPRAICLDCGSQEVEWFEAGGQGVIYSFSVVRRGATPAFRDAGPYVLAYVELDEGPRVLTNIVESDIEQLHVGDRVEATFVAAGEAAALVRFRALK